MSRQAERQELAAKIAARRPELAERMARTALIDVALDGRSAVHRFAASPVKGLNGHEYAARQAANDAKGRKTA